MAERVSTYLGEEAVRELDRLRDGLGQLSGCEISRSAAISSILTNQAGIYLETRRRLARVTAKYLPGGEFAPSGEDEARDETMAQHDAEIRSWKARQKADDPDLAFEDYKFSEDDAELGPLEKEAEE